MNYGTRQSKRQLRQDERRRRLGEQMQFAAHDKAERKELAELQKIIDEQTRMGQPVNWELIAALLIDDAGGHIEIDEQAYHYANMQMRRGGLHEPTRVHVDHATQLIVIESNPSFSRNPHRAVMQNRRTLPGAIFPSVSAPVQFNASGLMAQLEATVKQPEESEKIEFSGGPVKKKRRSIASKKRIHTDE